MTELVSSVAGKIDRAVQRVTPLLIGCDGLPPLGAAGDAQASQRFRRAKSVAVADPGTASLLKRTALSLRKRSTPVSVSCATIIRRRSIRSCASCSGKRFTSSRTWRPWPKTRRPTEHRTKDHARSAALRPDLQAGLKQEQVVAFYRSCRRWAWLRKQSTLFINSTRQRTQTHRYISMAHPAGITFLRS